MERSLAEQLAEVRRGNPRRDPVSDPAVATSSPYTENLSDYRQLFLDEQEVLSWAIENSGSVAQEFREQLGQALACSSCKCGCPSISLRFATPVQAVPDAPRLLAEFFGRADGLLVGGNLWTAGVRLAELEVYELEGVDRIFGLPSIDTLEVAEWHSKASDSD